VEATKPSESGRAAQNCVGWGVRRDSVVARVLLIQPPLKSDELFSRGSKSSASIIPPLGLAYISAYLREHGHTCRILDGVATPIGIGEVVDLTREYDVVGVTVVSTYAVRAGELIQAIKKANPRKPVVVGGPHVTVLPESLLEKGADFAVVGEGERTMLELVDCLTAGDGRVENVSGLVFDDGHGFTATGRRSLLDPLDEVPLPARDLLPMEKYRSSIARSSQQPSHSMLTSRGCPGVCSFCSKKTFGRRVRYFSVERIVDEFFVLRDRYQARDVAVMDDNFLSDPDVVFAVCEALKNRDLGITWSVEARVDNVSWETLSTLRDAGCTYIAYGVESGSQRLLDHMNKRITKEQIRETIRMTKEAGIAIRAYFMMGLPTETLQEMEATVRFAMELDVEVASFSLFLPLPGTIEYRRSMQSGRFPDPEYFLHRIVPEFNFMDAPLYIPQGMTAEGLMAAHRNAYTRYYFRPRVMLRRFLAIRSLGDFGNLLKGGFTLASNLFWGLRGQNRKAFP
jgi:radical SAM superfamily enzyme YgiQ (UPF0313 family)